MLGFLGIDVLFLFYQQIKTTTKTCPWICLVGDFFYGFESHGIHHHLGDFPGIQQANLYKRLTPKNANPTLCKGTAKVRVMTTWATGEGSMLRFANSLLVSKMGFPPKTNECPMKVQCLEDVCHFPLGVPVFF